MKIRLDYVSNSSSSSFVIAYDKKFFGDLRKFIQNNEIGYETRVYDIKEFLSDLNDDSWSENKDMKAKVAEAKKEKKTLLYFGVDYDQCSIIELMKYINKQNGGDKLTIIYEDG